MVFVTRTGRETVYVDVDVDDLSRVDSDEVFLFHRADCLGSTIGMTATTEREARQQFDAEPCSHCYDFASQSRRYGDFATRSRPLLQ